MGGGRVAHAKARSLHLDFTENAMVMASAASQNANEGIEKSKIDASQQTVDSGLQRDGRHQAKRLQQADLSGFIGADLWMVGKYER
jgi:hypothetical protein